MMMKATAERMAQICGRRTTILTLAPVKGAPSEPAAAAMLWSRQIGTTICQLSFEVSKSFELTFLLFLTAGLQPRPLCAAMQH
jgi:hypothetical protein